MAQAKAPRRPGRPPAMRATQPDTASAQVVEGEGFVIGFNEWAQVRNDAMRGAAALREVKEVNHRLDAQVPADSYVAKAIDELQRDMGTLGVELEAIKKLVDEFGIESSLLVAGTKAAIDSLRREMRRSRRRREASPRYFGRKRWPRQEPAPIVLASRAVAAD